MKHTLLLAAAVAIALDTSTALAGSLPPTTKSVVVNYADLDLSREPGALTLISRIVSAARVACGPKPDFQDTTGLELFETCVSEAANQAVATVPSRLVQEIYHGTGRYDIAGN